MKLKYIVDKEVQVKEYLEYVGLSHHLRKQVRRLDNIKVNGNKKSKLNQEVMKAVKNAGFEASVANTVASISTRLYGSGAFLRDVHNELKKSYPNGKEVYEVVKPVLSKYAE